MYRCNAEYCSGVLNGALCSIYLSHSCFCLAREWHERFVSLFHLKLSGEVTRHIHMRSDAWRQMHARLGQRVTRRHKPEHIAQDTSKERRKAYYSLGVTEKVGVEN